jgi:alcohol dehydrogenase (cytochrome c)
MTTISRSATVMALLMTASALTPARAADMTQERALNVAKEPQNWILHHGNYQGYRFSALNEISTGNAKNLKLMFSVALAGFEGGGNRYATGNLEATPLVEDGICMSPTAGAGSMHRHDQRQEGGRSWRFDPEIDPARRRRCCCGVITAAWRCGRTR